MNDRYALMESCVFYITENILGPAEESAEYEQLLNNYNFQPAKHCDCDNVCSLPECKCLSTSYEENVNSQSQVIQNNSEPIFECNERCSCSINCCNRIVQRGPINGLEIKHCDKGFGLYTKEFISKGSFVCEYAGELITKTQASMRHETNLKLNKMNYIFCLNEHFGGKIVQTFVDPSIFGNIGRYMNHSCDPNCHIVPVRCENLVPKLAIFTCRDIVSGDELTFHYGSNDSNSTFSVEKRVTCLCKQQNCTGFLPFHSY